MLPIVTFFILSLAVSLDGFSVGVMYGIRKIRVPMLSIAIISICSGIVIMGSMYIGVWLLQFMSPYVAQIIGASILISIGAWAIIQLKIQKHHDTLHEEKRMIRFEIKSLGIVIQILRTPSKADIDRSGNISAAEATLLGIALSLDAFGAGFGAALIGFPPLITAATIALSGGVFIFAGLRLGYIISGIDWMKRFSMLPGLVLIVMGVIKLF